MCSLVLGKCDFIRGIVNYFKVGGKLVLVLRELIRNDCFLLLEFWIKGRGGNVNLWIIFFFVVFVV